MDHGLTAQIDAHDLVFGAISVASLGKPDIDDAFDLLVRRTGKNDGGHGRIDLQFGGGTHQSATVAHHSDHLKVSFEQCLTQFRH